MAKKKKDEQEVSVESSQPELLKAVSYRIDKVPHVDDMGRKGSRLKHRIFQFTIDKSSDSIVSSELLIESSDPMEAMVVYQTAAGKIILQEKEKEHV